MLPHRDGVGDVGSAWDGRQVKRPASSASDMPRMASARLPPHPPDAPPPRLSHRQAPAPSRSLAAGARRGPPRAPAPAPAPAPASHSEGLPALRAGLSLGSVARLSSAGRAVLATAPAEPRAPPAAPAHPPPAAPAASPHAAAASPHAAAGSAPEAGGAGRVYRYIYILEQAACGPRGPTRISGRRRRLDWTGTAPPGRASTGPARLIGAPGCAGSPVFSENVCGMSATALQQEEPQASSTRNPEPGPRNSGRQGLKAVHT